MAAPSATARQTPAGIRLPDGFSSKLTIAADPDISLWERQVQPPGMDAGEPIDITTMHNVRWRTMVSRQLVTLTPFRIMCAYDPAAYTQILAVLGLNTTLTITWFDGSTLAFFGFVHKFTPGELVEGKMPEATVELCPTNYDTSAHTEQAPVLASAAGT